MRYFITFIFLVAINYCYGQQLKGNVTDKETHLPVNGALVSVGNAKAYTNSFGEFTISGIGDSIRISCIAYKTQILPISRILSTIRIELEPDKIALKEVTVHSSREKEYKLDSVNNRITYDKQFNY